MLLLLAPEVAEVVPPDWGRLVLGVLAGLVVFLLGVEHLGNAFSAVGDTRLQRLVDSCTRGPVTAVLTGIVACTVLDSSSATLIMIIAMIRGGMLTFEQSLGLVMGANIGTTIGAQIIALDVFGYAPVFLAVGFVGHLLARREGWKATWTGVLGAGLVFFGLAYIQDSVRPLRDHRPFIEWMQALGEAPLKGALTGAGVTAVLQSSSATVGMAIVMAKAGLISVPTGVAVMLGAEIGTVSNTLVAAVGRGREALRCAVFHFAFNLGSVVFGLALITPLMAMSEWLAPGAGDDAGHVARSIANAQVLFNVVGVAVVLPFTGPIARLLRGLIPGPSATSAGRGQAGAGGRAN